MALMIVSIGAGIEFDPDEDEPQLESAWPHLQVGLWAIMLFDYTLLCSRPSNQFILK
jgi:hypothetical protein